MNRVGGGSENEQSISSDMSANEVISKKLITFRDTKELQENNLKLILLVRDLSSKLEEIEENQNSVDQAAYESKLNTYAKRLEEYDEYRKEKLENEKMMNDQFDSMRTELRELTSNNCRLMSTVENLS